MDSAFFPAKSIDLPYNAMTTLTVQDMKAILSKMDAIMADQKDVLTELDAAIGDGDLGLTMTRGFSSASKLAHEMDESDIGKMLAKVGMNIAQVAPSTMGTLVGSGFMKSGKALKGRESLDLAGLTEAISQFLEGIMARGKAQPGGKTIIDALHPAVQALQEAVAAEKTLQDGVQDGYQAACRGVEATKEMMAQYGRPAYYQEKSIGKQDPGATVGMLIMQAFAEYVTA